MILHPHNLGCRPSCSDLGLSRYLVNLLISEPCFYCVCFLGCSVIQPNDSRTKRVTLFVRKYKSFALRVNGERIYIQLSSCLLYLSLDYSPIAFGVKFYYVAVCVKGIVCS